MRILNLVRILSSYLISLMFKRIIHSGDPVFISIEPTNRCNLHCPECPTGTNGLNRPAGNLSLPSFLNLLDQIKTPLMYLILYFQGEPFLNQDFPSMVAEAKKRKIHVWSSTNGHFLTDTRIRETIRSGLDKLIISLDGTTQEVYEQYRKGGNLKVVLDGIKRFVAIRNQMKAKKPKLVIQFLVLQSNEHQMDEIEALGKELGADRVEFKSAQLYHFQEGHSLMPEGKRWKRYKWIEETGSQGGPGTGRQEGRGAGRYVLKHKVRNRCFRIWAGCVITWDGKVVPCCYDKDAKYIMGDLNKETFDSIWHGERFQSFRKRVLTYRKSIDICNNCPQRV